MTSAARCVRTKFEIVVYTEFLSIIEPMILPKGTEMTYVWMMAAMVPNFGNLGEDN